MTWLLRLVGLMLMLTALAVSLSRAPDRPVQSLVARWAPPPSDFIELKGQIVHLRDVGPRGDPVPLILLHGTGASLHTWEGWTAVLARSRRVISVDLPGFGLTGPFSGAPGGYAADDYRGDTYARFVLDLMDALRVPRAVIVGNSLGGEIAWRTAALAPARVERLVLLDATGYDFAPGRVPLGFRVAALPVLGRIGEHLLPRALVAQSVQSVYGDPARVTEPVVDRYFELTLREGNRHALGLRRQQAVRGQDFERARTIKLPTLLIWGGQDRLIPPAVAQTFLKTIEGSQLVTFLDLGHVPQEEDPVRTVVPVKTFLDLR